MELNKDQYTKQEVEEIINGFNKELNDLKNVVAEANKLNEKYKELEKTNLATAIKNEMLKAGIDESLYDLVDAPDIKAAQNKITKLIELRKKDKMDNSFKPDNHKSDSSFEKMEKDRDTVGMIAHQLKKIFE